MTDLPLLHSGRPYARGAGGLAAAALSSGRWDDLPVLGLCGSISGPPSPESGVSIIQAKNDSSLILGNRSEGFPCGSVEKNLPAMQEMLV